MNTATHHSPSPSASGSPVAVIGIACRMPHAPHPDAYWRMLRDGRHGLSTAPPDRFGPEAGHSGGFLDQVDRFDPAFFGMSPREAAVVDPQQRLILELAWEALEDARIVPTTLAGGDAGVFIGAMWDDFTTLVHRDATKSLTPHTLTGTRRGIIANRVSYTLGLRGPSLTVDAAQASSLVAVHLAAESLHRRQARLALAGGVNLQLVPESTAESARFGALSPDGRCFTFDARANGYVRGEGGAVVVLKRLADALADGDPIYCVIQGSAVNNDGATVGLTVPSAEAQAAVIRTACLEAGVEPTAVQYVELHGTGTKVGDPIEAAALGAALGSGRAAGSELAVGSAKTNVGHLEGAAGIAGLVKVALSIRHRELPPSLNFQTPNPDIDLDALGLRVRTTSGPWPAPDKPLVAGVSSFGMGGTNCHIVVAEPPEPTRPDVRPVGATGRVVPWVLSGHTRPALRAQAARLREYLEAGPDLSIHDVGWSLATTRTPLPHRGVVVGATRTELLSGLSALVDGAPASGLIERVAGEPGGTVLVFPWQGSEWPGMALDLMDSSETFKRTFDACASVLASHVGWSPLAVLRGDPEAPPLDRVDVVQPLLFAVMVSLARVWQACGVRPDAVVGHSEGEVAAACVAGALSLPDAARVVVIRSRALAALAGTGGMATVGLCAARVAPLLERWGGELAVAAVDGPTATVVSGPPRPLAELVAACEADGVEARVLPVDYAAHCALVEPIRERLLTELADIRPRGCETAFYSSVTGTVTDTATLDAEYWYANLRRPAIFHQTVQALSEDGHRAYIEASPHAVLTAPIRETLETSGVEPLAVVGTLRRDASGPREMLGSFAELHARGVPVTWTEVFAGTGAAPVALPTYAFQRERHWPNNIAEPACPAPNPAQRLSGADAGANAQQIGGEVASWTERLAGQSSAEQRRAMTELVRGHTADILGHAVPETVGLTTTFKDLGLDSVLALQVRNRLADALGTPLPTGVVYDHPTCEKLSTFLLSRMLGEETPSTTTPTRTSRFDDEAIAIVGMGCRFPGDVSGPEDLWRLLAEGQDAIGDFPDNRGWRLQELYDPRPGTPGKVYVRQGGFVRDADLFDAAFFAISPREAVAMEPQQRLLLEVAWETFEHAGIDAALMSGSETGVFVGAMAQEYGPRLRDASESAGGLLLSGTAGSVASGRLAYSFGFEGPALTVDTACSSSLVALHMACQSLRQGECAMALAGGATVLASPGIFTEFSRQRGLAPDGRCKSFSSTADGTAWAEGVGLVLLEPLSRARRYGHRVLAVVRGSAVNQDGASNGLTAPNGRSQQRLIRTALANAGLRPEDVDAVEAHGTGTVLGDPIEAQAILATYGQGRAGDRPLWLGSLKSNIGHAQAAAGVGGVIKMVQALRYETLPRTLHVVEPTAHVDWSTSNVRLLTEPVPWPAGDRPRRAGVSSFGISGTNAHLILEEPPSPEDVPQPPAAPYTTAWPISAKTDRAVKAGAHQLLDHLLAHPEAHPAEVALRLASRTHFSHRAVVIGTSREELLTALRTLAHGGAGAQAVEGSAKARRELVVLFTGRGPQRPGTGRELYDAYPIFADALDETSAHLDPHLEQSLTRVLFTGPDHLLNEARYAHAAAFAVETALYRLLESFGVTPDHLLGYSAGTVAAAHAAGVLSHPDACALIAARGQQALGDVATTVKYSTPMIPILSEYTGEAVPPDQLADPTYWIERLSRPVAPRTDPRPMRTTTNTTYLELVSAVPTGIEPFPASALRAGQPEARTFLNALAQLHATGIRVDWTALHDDVRPIDLPNYPFQRKRYWLEPCG